MRVVEAALPAEPASTENDQWLDNGGNNGEKLSKDEETGEGEATNEEDEEEYDEGDYDAEAEAEAVARALGDQIWAGLGQGLEDTVHAMNFTQDDTTTQPTIETGQGPPEGGETNEDSDTAPNTLPHDHQPPITESLEQSPQPVHVSPQPNAPAAHDPMIETIKTMLSLALCDPHVHYALMTTIVPGPVANGANLYTILSNSVLEGRVNPELAEPLSILISALASGSVLVASESSYSTPSHPDPAMSTSPLKRKREPADEGQGWPTHTAYNPSVQPTNPPHPSRSPTSVELVARIQSATSDILQVLDPLLSTGQSLNQPALSSIQRQLHQVYSFVSTCPQQQEPVGGGSLQEIGGLIQVIGILNGVPIAQSTDSTGHPEANASDSNRGGRGSNTFSTSIYPCSTCSKAFNKLSSLRAHERTHSEGRPYRCEYAGCPASFARNHDLRRHEKSHERQMFRCRGCDRLFSRRDALRRHKTNEKALDECRDAPMDTSTVQHDGDPPRVTRVWQNHPEGGDWPRESEFEDGEIQPDAVSDARDIVGRLYKTLQQHVTKGLSAGGDGEQSGQPPTGGTQDQEELTDSAHTEARAAPTVDISQEETIQEEDNATRVVPPDSLEEPKPMSTLPGYGLDDEHASLLERAIAVAAQAAQAQAEAEAAMYEGLYDDEQDADEWGEEGNEEDKAEREASVEGVNLVC